MRAVAAAANKLLRLFVDDVPTALATIALLIACGALARNGLVEDLRLAAVLVAGSVAILLASVVSA